jgi:beta-glucosidase
VITPLEGIQNRAGKNIKVTFAPGCFIHKILPAPAPATLSSADGRAGLQLSLFNGIECSGAPVYSEKTTRVQHGWFSTSVPKADQESFSMRMEGFFTPQESGLHTLSVSAVGWGKLYLDGNLIIDHSADTDMGKQLTADLSLEGGKSYPLKLEY